MFEVKKSPLHGRGLFATMLIPANMVIGWLVTQPAPEDELDGPYVLWVDGENPVRVMCDMRFINHSDEPNAAYYDDLSVVALRDIQPGEELVHDYMGDADDGVEVGFEVEIDPTDQPIEELVGV